MIRRLRAVSAVAVAAALTLAGCTTVPDSSTPQIVQPVEVESQVPPPGPLPGSDPRTIVQGFLTANGANDPNHSAARQYLAKPAKGWSDLKVTVVDHAQVGNVVFGKRGAGGGRTGTITVTGDEIGTIDDTGTYTPFLTGNGSGFGGESLPQTYRVAQVDHEWRITSLPSGLLISSAQFLAFHQYKVYFFDASGQDLIPTARYTQLSDPNAVVQWLVQNQLAGQPPAQLTSAIPPSGAANVKVSYPADPSDPSQPIRVEVPGASGLDNPGLDRLATQLAATLQQVPQVDRIQITDNGKPVRIPAVNSTVFSVESLGGRFQPVPAAKQLFFVNSGAVYEESGRRIPGRAGLGVYGLSSVAVSQAPSGALEVAGVRGSPGNETLDIPNPHGLGALEPTAVHGTLSRPSWAPGRHEVWIGNGTSLDRVTGPRSVQDVPLNVTSGKAAGRVIAVRISPDGGRVALVLSTANSSQIYVGTIVRSPNQVSIEDLQPISPQGVKITDVAWNDQLKLFATGSDTFTRVQQVYEVQCDGSLWTPRVSGELPGAPQRITAAAQSAIVVSVGDTIYEQQGASWQSLLNGESYGTNPVYME